MTDVLDLRCTACGRAFGWVVSSARGPTYRFYCTPMCLRDGALSPEEVRNDRWRMLKANGITPFVISKWWGIHHAQVYRVTGR